MKFCLRVLTILHLLTHFIVFTKAKRGGHGLPDPKLWAKNFVARDTIITDYVLQSLNHFDPLNTANWSQRYFSNSRYYNAEVEGPVFIMLGGESEIDSIWIEYGFMMEMCQQKEGIAFQVEHRYYGKSFPTNDLTIDSLKYLTVDQVLADIANFIQTIKIKYNLQNNKIILVGGSYPGQLAILFREKYPFLVDIVWASSASVLLKFDCPEYVETVGNVIRGISPVCYDEIKGAIDELEEMIWDCHYNVTSKMDDDPSDKNRPPNPQIPYCVRNLKKFMNETFSLCQPFNVYIEDDIRGFFQALKYFFGYVVQYNNQMGNYTIQNYCSRVFANSTLNLTRIQKVSFFIKELQTNFLGETCIDYSEESYCNAMSYTGVDTKVDRQWDWLKCYQVFLLVSAYSQEQPFGHSVTRDFLIRQCKCAFGDRFVEDYIEAQEEARRIDFGERDGTKYTSRIVFTQGLFDPWYTTGIYSQNQTSCSNKVVVIPGTSHAFDLITNHSYDPPAVITARNEIRNQIFEWLDADIPCCAEDNISISN